MFWMFWVYLPDADDTSEIFHGKAFRTTAKKSTKGDVSNWSTHRMFEAPVKKGDFQQIPSSYLPGVSVFRWVSDFFSRKSLKGDFSILVVGSRNGGLESGSHGESFANAVHPGFGILTSIGIRLRKVTIWRANLLIQVLKGSPTILRGWGLRSYAATTAS